MANLMIAATISSLWGLRGQDLSTLNLSADQLLAVERQLSALTASPWLALAPLLERCIAMLLHVILSVSVWSAFRRRNPLYLLAAVLYHAINGMKIMLFDFWPSTTRHMKALSLASTGLFLLLMLPITWLIGTNILESAGVI